MLRIILTLMLALGTAALLADEGEATRAAGVSAAPDKPARKSGTVARPLVITPEREAAAMTFVRQHHAELAELLSYLKESSPKEFERAVRDLFRTSERLAQIQERDAAAYGLELRLWKARSRAHLLGAQLRMADDDQLRQQLRSELAEEYDLRMQILQRERDKVAERLKGLDSQLERLNARRDDSIERQFELMTSAARKARVSTKTGSKKKAKSKTTPTPSPTGK